MCLSTQTIKDTKKHDTLTRFEKLMTALEEVYEFNFLNSLRIPFTRFFLSKVSSSDLAPQSSKHF